MSKHTTIPKHAMQVCEGSPLATASISRGGSGGKERQDLLSDDVVVMRRVHLERAVVGPEVYGRGDARDAALVDHLRSLGTANRELQVGILLPVAEEERKLGEKAVIDVANQFNSGRARVARNAAFEVRGASNERFPPLEVVFILDLDARKRYSALWWGGVSLTTALSSLLISPAASSPVYCIWAMLPRPVANMLSLSGFFQNTVSGDVIEGLDCATDGKRSVVVESLRRPYRGSCAGVRVGSTFVSAVARQAERLLPIAHVQPPSLRPVTGHQVNCQ
jgi:hypothetical protein